MALRWTLRAHDAQLVETIERTSHVSPVVAQILALRGIASPEQVSSFLDLKMTGLRPPEQLPGMTQAVETIYSAISEKQNILIYGDYDADGMTSTAILYRCLKLLGANVNCLLMHLNMPESLHQIHILARLQAIMDHVAYGTYQGNPNRLSNGSVDGTDRPQIKA